MTSRKMLGALLLAGSASLAGCSGNEPAPPGTAVVTPAGAPDCGGVAAVVKDHLRSPDVLAVSVDGQCSNVVVDTGLADEDTAGGKRLCDAAAEVAYTGDTNAVTVHSKAGTEISIGVAGAKCLESA
ncbi:hypothetical protein ACWKSP_08945 [Micromonosporaceae bacterium Da 78-11]